MSEMNLEFRALIPNTETMSIVEQGFHQLKEGKFEFASSLFSQVGGDNFVDSPEPSWRVESASVDGKALSGFLLAHIAAFNEPTDFFVALKDLGATHVLGTVYDELGGKQTFAFMGDKSVAVDEVECVFNEAGLPSEPSQQSRSTIVSAQTVCELLEDSRDDDWLDGIAAYNDANSDLNAKCPDWDGWTLLHAAAHLRNLKAIRQLVEYGADINAIDEHGQTPLHCAMDSGYQEAQRLDVREFKSVTLLLELDADPALRDKDGRAPSDLNDRYHDPQLAAIINTLFDSH